MAMTASCTQESVQLAPVVSDEDACERAKEAVVDAHLYEMSQIASCEMSDKPTGQEFYVMRLNGHCREDVCGSILLGWYGVERETGRVFDWDIAENRPGGDVSEPPVCQYDCL